MIIIVMSKITMFIIIIIIMILMIIIMMIIIMMIIIMITKRLRLLSHYEILDKEHFNLMTKMTKVTKMTTMTRKMRKMARKMRKMTRKMRKMAGKVRKMTRKMRKMGTCIWQASSLVGANTNTMGPSPRCNNVLYLFVFFLFYFASLFAGLPHLEIRLVVAVDDSRQEISEGLARTCLRDANHVLEVIGLFFFFSFIVNLFACLFVCLFACAFVRLLIGLSVCVFTCPVSARGQPCDWIGVGAS